MIGTVNKIANLSAVILKRNAPEVKYSVEEYEYGFKIIYNNLIILLSLIVILGFMGHLGTGLIIILSFIILRFFSGGLHVRSSELCIIISVILIVGLTIGSVYFDVLLIQYHYAVNWISILVLFLFAPSGIENNLKLSNLKHRYILKVISISLVLMNTYLFHSSAITITFFLQSLTTISVKRADRHHVDG